MLFAISEVKHVFLEGFKYLKTGLQLSEWRWIEWKIKPCWHVFVKRSAPNYTLVSTKMPILKRGITLTKLIQLFGRGGDCEINQVSYYSALISSPNFKALAQIVITIDFLQEKHDKRMDGQKTQEQYATPTFSTKIRKNICDILNAADLTLLTWKR